MFVVPIDSYAKTSQNFAWQYGLLVHQANRDKIMTRIQVLTVLLRFFPDASLEIDIHDDESICSFDFFDCTDRFYGYREITQKEFLLWIHYLKSMNECIDIGDFDNNLYYDLWFEARNNNWLTGNEITYGVFEDFLYRYSVSDKFFNHPYYESLVLDIDEITTDRFSEIDDLPTLQSDLFKHILELKSLSNRTGAEKVALAELNGYYQRFKELEGEIKELNHPFNLIPTLPGYIKENITKYGLEGVLSQISYDYSSNIVNRKHNLVTGVSKVNGKVYMPGDVMDFMGELSDKNWWDYKWGWVIINGQSEWLLGGGLCGSATMVFTPSWLAGLQIIKRYPHSLYYNSLYPVESLGLDATIYRGSHKNLKIRNNTDDPIIYYVEDDKENEVLTLYIIGNSPYKSVEIEGPIQIDKTTYKWIRKMENEDGTVNTEELVTKYWGIY
ncbi:VanW family protein [Patescibacteria group bacterium]|nr:VanW family protein [Patescibacteria group bacterium]